MKKLKIAIVLLLLITLFSGFTYGGDYLDKKLKNPAGAIFLGTTSGTGLHYLIFDMSYNKFECYAGYKIFF